VGTGPINKYSSKLRQAIIMVWRRINLNRLLGLLFFPLALAAAGWVLIHESSQIPWQSLHFQGYLLILSFLVECSGLLIAIPIWRRILASYGIRQHIRDDIRIYCYSMLGFALPGGVWTIIGRSSLYNRLGSSGLQVATAGVIEAILSGVGGLIVYALASIFAPKIYLWKQPLVGLVFGLLALVIIFPPVFNRFAGWVLAKTQNNKSASLQVGYTFRNLATWILLEAGVVLIGGIAIFIFLRSIVDVPNIVAIRIILAWGAAAAVSNLFFWLPGTLIIRDGVMALVLIPEMSPAMAFIFVVLQHLWFLGSVLLVTGIVWLILDFPKAIYGKQP
jgi:hypothetical protein